MLTSFVTGCLLLVPTAQAQVPETTQLEEVMANVRAQSLGSGTVDDLALPEDFLRRLSDRILRRSFEDHFRIVVDAQVAETAAAGSVSPGGTAAGTEPAAGTSIFRSVLDVLALLALGVLTVLAYFAWKARARRDR